VARQIGPFAFPETGDEASAWKPTFSHVMLHRKVMVLAKTRIEGKWSAYCFPVPGHNHYDEEYLWENEGAKLPADIARLMFPDFAEVPYAS